MQRRPYRTNLCDYITDNFSSTVLEILGLESIFGTKNNKNNTNSFDFAKIVSLMHNKTMKSVAKQCEIVTKSDTKYSTPGTINGPKARLLYPGYYIWGVL